MKRKIITVLLSTIALLFVPAFFYQNCQKNESSVLSSTQTEIATRSINSSKEFSKKQEDQGCSFIVQIKPEYGTTIKKMKISDTSYKNNRNKKEPRSDSGLFYINSKLNQMGISGQAKAMIMQNHRFSARGKIRKRKTSFTLNQKLDSALEKIMNTNTITLKDSNQCTRVFEEFQKDNRVFSIALNHKQTAFGATNDTYFSTKSSWGQAYDDLWTLKSIDAPSAWDITQGENVLVAVIDTGVDLHHADISENIWINPGESGVVDGIDRASNGIDDDENGFIDDVHGWNFISNSNNSMDDAGHGTHVSGTIAALKDNHRGIVGVAPKAKILPVKVLDSNGSGDLNTVIEGIKYAVDMGAEVINLSLGCVSRCPYSPLYEEIFKYAAKNETLIIKAAGNSSDDVSLYSPENLLEDRGVLVSAHTNSDKLAVFSNYGQFIDIAAPGGGDLSSTNLTAMATLDQEFNILSLRPQLQDDDLEKFHNSILTETQHPLILGTSDEKYVRLAGTSMAAPHVAGVAALILSKFPNLSIQQVKRILLSGARDIGDIHFDQSFGQGALNAFNSLQENTIQTPIARILTPLHQQTNSNLALSIYGLALAHQLDSYSLYYATDSEQKNWNNKGFTLINDGKNEVEGLLGTLKINLLRKSKPLHLKLVVNDKNGRQATAYQTVSYSTQEKEGWPINLGEESWWQPSSESVFADDFDGDGSKEVHFIGTTPFIPKLYIANSKGQYFSKYNGENDLRSEYGTPQWATTKDDRLTPYLFGFFNNNKIASLMLLHSFFAKDTENHLNSRYRTVLHELNGEQSLFSNQDSNLDSGNLAYAESQKYINIGPDKNIFYQGSKIESHFVIDNLIGERLEQNTVPDRGSKCSSIIYDNEDKSPDKKLYYITKYTSFSEFGQNQYSIVVSDLKGKLKKELPLNLKSQSCFSTEMIVKDLDRDHKPEFVVIERGYSFFDSIGANARIQVLNSDGSLRSGWPFQLKNGLVIHFPISEFGSSRVKIKETVMPNTLRVEDLNGDGNLEIILGSSQIDTYSDSIYSGTSSRIHALNAEGQELPGWPIILRNKKLVGIVTGKSTGASKQQLCASSTSTKSTESYLECFNTEGKTTGWKQIFSNSPVIGYPLITDLENDGIMEIGIRTIDQVHFWSF